MMKKISATLAALTLIAVPAVSADPMEVTPLTVRSADVEHVFSVEIANDDEEISYGLMHRDSMDADSGMLFDFGRSRETAMFMKDTLIPLDMLFISVDGTVEMIARNTVPGSLRTISPGKPVRGVLELNGGRAAELGLQPGDTVVHAIFGNGDADTGE